MKSYWHPKLMRPLTDAEVETIRFHEHLHAECRRILNGRTSIGLPDHVADAAIAKILQTKGTK